MKSGYEPVENYKRSTIVLSNALPSPFSLLTGRDLNDIDMNRKRSVTLKLNSTKIIFPSFLPLGCVWKEREIDKLERWEILL